MKLSKKDQQKIQARYVKMYNEYILKPLSELKEIAKTKLSSTDHKALYDSAVEVQAKEIKEGNLKATME